MSETVARRYARALFELAQEANSLREASSGLRSFADAYEASADFRALQLQPGISETQRVAIIKNIGTRLGAPSLVTRSVALLAERRRLAQQCLRTLKLVQSLLLAGFSMHQSQWKYRRMRLVATTSSSAFAIASSLSTRALLLAWL